MKVFKYQDQEYIRVIPGKKLFNSTMIHEVVNRGDIFAVRISDQTLTIIPGEFEAEFTDVELVESQYLAELENTAGVL